MAKKQITTIPWFGIFTNPTAYLAFLKVSRWKLAQFTLVSLAGLIALQTAVFFLHFRPQLQSQLAAGAQEFSEKFPNETTIAWDGQQLSLEPNEPLTISYNEVLDPSTTGLPPLFAQYAPTVTQEQDVFALESNSLLTLSPTTLYVSDTQQVLSQQSLRNVLGSDSFSWTKDQLVANIEQYLPAFFEFISLALLLFIPLRVAVGLSFEVLFNSLLIYFFVSVISKLPLTFKQIFRFSLPLVAVTHALDILIELLYWQNALKLGGIAFWIIFFFVVRAYALSVGRQQQQRK